ncbi:MAG: NTP transferase domain-containing protein [Bacteroidota bacterium]
MNDARVGTVVLSRFNSTRLPGKALMTIQGKPILLYIVERLRQVFSDDHIVIATSDEDSDDPIAEFCNDESIRCFRGSLSNVAERFYQAGKELDVDYIARINGDNVFIDIPLLKQMVRLAQSDDYLFVSNVKNRTFPKGMSIEIISVKHYKQLLPAINDNPEYQEHVTLFLYQNERPNYKFVVNTENTEFSGIQLALDTKEDFSRTEQIISYFEEDHTCYGMIEIFEILKKMQF